MPSRVVIALGLVSLLAATGCELLTAIPSKSFSRVRRPETSWEKTMKSMDRIPFRDPVLTPIDPIPTLVARPVEPKHPEKFQFRQGHYRRISDYRRPTVPPASDEEQLAASLKWLEEEFGIPPEIELHRGLTKSFDGADPNEVALFAWYRGLQLPGIAVLSLEGAEVIDATVWLFRVSEVDGSARSVVGVETARQTMQEWLHTHERESKRKAAARIWPAHHCMLQFERPAAPPETGDDLLIPVWSCDSRNATRVAAYEGTPYRLQAPEP